MKIIKRNGSEEVFDIRKIVRAITKADTKAESRSLTDGQIEDIAEYVEFKCNKLNRAVSVEEIQDMVENQIMATGAFDLARRYVRYRYKRSLVRRANTTDNRILSLIECNNEDVKQENSNKNPAVNSVQQLFSSGTFGRRDTGSIVCRAAERFGGRAGLHVCAVPQRAVPLLRGKHCALERLQLYLLRSPPG